MNNKALLLAKNILVTLILIIGVVFIVQAMGTEVDPETGMAVGDIFAVSASVDLSMGLVWGGLGLIGVFTILAIIAHPKRFIPTMISIGVFGIIILIGYSMGDSTPIASIDPIKYPQATAANYQIAGMAIQTTYILIGVAIFLILAQVVRGFVGYFAKN